MSKWIFLLIGVVFNASANIILKIAAGHTQSMSSRFSDLIRKIFDPYQILGIVCFGIALLSYSYSLTKFELSIAYPLMTSLGLVIVTLFSIIIFKETFNLSRAFGTLLIILGVIFVAKSA